MGFIFISWAFVSLILVFVAVLESIHENGKPLGYLTAGIAVWSFVAFFPCLVFVLMSWLIKLA